MIHAIEEMRGHSSTKVKHYSLREKCLRSPMPVNKAFRSQHAGKGVLLQCLEVNKAVSFKD